MGDFGSVSWKVFEKFVFIRGGCVFVRQRGDHRVYFKEGIRRPIVILQYNPLPPFVILNNLRLLGISKDEFKDFLGR